MKYVYGPVSSRRLGFSLGISVTPYKTCSFDCVYCQLGVTTHKTAQIGVYNKTDEIIEELKGFFQSDASKATALDYVTLSGFGEPTLHAGIAQLIAAIRQLTTVPIAVITNSSLLTDRAARAAVAAADLIVPTLNAATQKDFEAVCRPFPELKIDNIIEALVALRREFRGQIWLEVMLIKGFNDDIRKIKKLKEVVDLIRPDKIQLNSPIRTSPEQQLFPVEKDKLELIREILGEKCEVL